MKRETVARLEQVASGVVRKVRSVPAADAAAVRVATRLRESRLAREVISRAFDVDVTGTGGTVFLGAGHLLAGQGLDNLPVVILSLVGTPSEDVPGLLDELAIEQVLTGGFRPVLVLAEDHFAVVRRHGWPVELVIAQHEWPADGRWTDYLERRLQSIRRDYQAIALLPLDGSGLTMTFLRSLGPKTPRD